MTSSIHYWLRASLAGPPGACATDVDQAAIYRAALTQFEQLLDAASTTGYAARPLLLYYALAQAGRAINARHGAEPAKAHGLALPEDQLDPEDPMAAEVCPRDNGWFPTVAVAAGSPPLAGPVALGALIRSLPELAQPFIATDWPPARFVSLLDYPGAFTSSFALEGGVAISDDEDPQEVSGALADIYPSVAASGWTPDPGRRTASTIAGRSLVLHPDASRLEPFCHPLDGLAAPYRWVERRWLRPTLAGSEPPSPLMTWWLLLYALSMLARYHPTFWSAALDREASVAAAELERALDMAVAAIPHLVLEAILGRPLLLAPVGDTPPLSL